MGLYSIPSYIPNFTCHSHSMPDEYCQFLPITISIPMQDLDLPLYPMPAPLHVYIQNKILTVTRDVLLRRRQQQQQQLEQQILAMVSWARFFRIFKLLPIIIYILLKPLLWNQQPHKVLLWLETATPGQLPPEPQQADVLDKLIQYLSRASPEQQQQLFAKINTSPAVQQKLLNRVQARTLAAYSTRGCVYNNQCLCSAYENDKQVSVLDRRISFTMHYDWRGGQM